MKRYILYIILCSLTLGVTAQAAPKNGVTVDCGTWYTLSAQPYEDYHFVEWNDGSKDSVRYIEATANASYIAFFASNCAEWANWPVVALYDWLLMLNITEINAKGYFFKPNNVTWYRVIGEPDSPTDERKDDEVVGHGFYLTLAKNFWGTGDYYAVVDVSVNATAQLCTDVMRSVIVHYAGTPHRQQLALLPNATTLGGQIKLVGLDPSEQTTIQVYSSAGQLMDTFTSTDEAEYMLTAAGVSGCFYVRVSSPTIETVLKYLVFAK